MSALRLLVQNHFTGHILGDSVLLGEWNGEGKMADPDEFSDLAAIGRVLRELADATEAQAKAVRRATNTLEALVSGYITRAGGAPILTVGPMVIDIEQRRLSAYGKTIDVPLRTLKLLIFFAERQGRVVTNEALAEEFWSSGTRYEDPLANARQGVHQMKKSLAEVGCEEHIQKTLKGRHMLLAVLPPKK